MAFSLRIGPMLVTADTAAEAAELVRALGPLAPEPLKRPQGTGSVIETPAGYQIRLRTGPGGKRIHRGGFKSREEAETALTALVDTGVAPPLRRHRRASPPPANDPIADAAQEEPAHAPIWPEWSRRAPTVGEGREEPPAAVAIPAPVVAPAAPARRGRPIGRGSIQKRGPERFVVILSNGKTTKFGGSFRTQAEAETAREAIYQARLRGEQLPQFASARPCGRCRKTGHIRRDCQTPEAELPAKPRADETERREKIAAGVRALWEKRRAADPIGHKYRANVRKHLDGWALGLVGEGRARWGGTFETELQANAARDAWLAAARAGAELPDFRKRVLSCRCGSVEHGTAACPKRAAAPAPSPAAARAPKTRGARFQSRPDLRDLWQDRPHQRHVPDHRSGPRRARDSCAAAGAAGPAALLPRGAASLPAHALPVPSRGRASRRAAGRAPRDVHAGRRRPRRHHSRRGRQDLRPHARTHPPGRDQRIGARCEVRPPPSHGLRVAGRAR